MVDKGVREISRQQRNRAVGGTQDGQFERDVRGKRFEYDAGALTAIGELAGLSGLFAAFGHSHYGLGMAPATGRLIAGMVAGVASNAETSAYAPDRFV